MNSLDTLGLLVNGFGWGLMVVACAVGIAVLYRDALVRRFALVFREDYDGLSVDEMLAIEEARAELAQKVRERAEAARISAAAARFEALAAFALYRPIWAVSPILAVARQSTDKAASVWSQYQERRESEALDALRVQPLNYLMRFAGVGPKRARRILDAGDALTAELLRGICGPAVASRLLATA